MGQLLRGFGEPFVALEIGGGLAGGVTTVS
jgi:hypothetical protein